MTHSVELRCPQCNRYLGTLTANFQGSADVRAPCPKCSGDLRQRITVKSTSGRETSCT